MSEIKSFPNPKDFLLEAPLYQQYKRESSEILKLRDFNEKLDIFCVECGDISVFSRLDKTPSQIRARIVTPSIGSGLPYHDDKWKNFFFDMQYECARDKNHVAVFLFFADEQSVCKVGEHPSLTDRLTHGFDKYKEILGREQISLQVAQGLYAQGIGAGSFVYLRRVFENVIVERIARRRYKHEKEWTLAKWKNDNHTMSQKLTDLKGWLPDFISSKELFRILSAGVHQLDEETCLLHFNIVIEAIIEVLDEEYRIAKKKIRRKKIGRNVSKVHRDIKGKPA